jgi:hypothetical protein
MSKELDSLLLAMWQSVEALGDRTRTLAWDAASCFPSTRTVAGADKPGFLQGWVLKTW